MNGGYTMKAVISVIGADKVGILAKVSAICYQNNCNIVDVTQKVLQEYFTMVMIVEIDECTVSFSDLSRNFPVCVSLKQGVLILSSLYSFGHLLDF